MRKRLSELRLIIMETRRLWRRSYQCVNIWTGGKTEPVSVLWCPMAGNNGHRWEQEIPSEWRLFDSAGIMVLWFLLLILHTVTACRALGVKELMFQFYRLHTYTDCTERLGSLPLWRQSEAKRAETDTYTKCGQRLHSNSLHKISVN